MAGATPKARVVVADDSGLMRRILAEVLRRRSFEVVGTAADGDEALALCREHRPDALTLDLHMPGLDGLGVLRALRDGRERPVPTVVVSAFSPAHGARAVDALAEGAFDLVAKPGPGDSLEAFTGELGRKVAEAAKAGRKGVRPVRRLSARAGAEPRAPAGVHRLALSSVVVIASSTGGPRALAELVPALPVPLGAGGVVVQHMPAGFTASLAARLDRATRLDVREARTGDAVGPAHLLVAPGGVHLRIGPDRRIRLADDAPEGGLKPRADLTIRDAARAYGSRVLLVVLTGMGRDGLVGAAAVRAAGGRVIVEAASTCTVHGMPRAVEEAGLADLVLPLDRIADAIAKELA